MSQQEIQQRQGEIQQRQQEAVTASIENITSSIESKESVEVIEEARGQAPLVVVSGNSGEILGLLGNERVSAIISEEQATQALQPQQPPTPGGQSPPSP